MASTASGSSSSINEMSFPAARLSPWRSAATRSRTDSRGRDGLRAVGSRSLARLLEERHDLAERRARSEDRFDAPPFELRDFVRGGGPSADLYDSSGPPFLQETDVLAE